MRTRRILSTGAVTLVAIGAAWLLIAALASAGPAADAPAWSAGYDAGVPRVFDAEQADARAAVNAQQWLKTINDKPWEPRMEVTVETSDTIKVTDIITALPFESVVLYESWDPAHLKLLDYAVEPDGSQIVEDEGVLRWEVPEGEQRVFILTKWFHVEPCTWTSTDLSETLSTAAGQLIEERTVAIVKEPPLLELQSVHNPEVYAGDIATFTLSYGNKGGYENGVRIVNTFPISAPFAWSEPPPDEVSADRLNVVWKLGDLQRDAAGEIGVAVAIREDLPPSTTIEIWDWIYDHVGEPQVEVITNFHVEAPPLTGWEKLVNRQPWTPDLLVTAQTSDTIEIIDIVERQLAFSLNEFWNPNELALMTAEASEGTVTPAAGMLEWAVGAGPPGPVILTKTFHVEEGFWPRTVIEEFLGVPGAPPLVRLVPVEHDFPPITFPDGDWPWYAQEEITVHPDPPIAGHPTEICAEVVNRDPVNDHVVEIEFAIANFGIGVPFTPVGRAAVPVPAGGHAKGCVVWVPPTPDHWCIEARLVQERVPYAISQRNVDVDEPLRPLTAHSRVFPVGNPTDQQADINLRLLQHAPGWVVDITPDVLPDLPAGEHRPVTLTVTPPDQLPPDGAPIVDVEALIQGEVIGGFRKFFRPPVPLHRFPDPPYAEREITVHPYPPIAGQPTEICVELRNPTPYPQDVEVQFSWANFGIGLPFTPINGRRPVHLPPHSVVNECIHWVPPVDGHVCLQAELFMEGYDVQRSQRNIDVNEPLRPHVPHSVTFPVRNPFNEPVSITLGLVPHLPGWGLELSRDFLPNVPAGRERQVTLTVTPPDDLPPDRHPVVDVEAYAGDTLIGGFRKVFRPPVPLHPYPDPPYAEREITVEPYPAVVGRPTEICVELRNPTPYPQDVEVQFSWANFGIGLPFTPINGLRPIHLPPYSVVRECIHWVPPVDGHVCLQVELFMEGYDVQRSQRNVDVNEPLEPNTPHSFTFPVRNPYNEPISITLGLVPHLPGWGLELSRDFLPNVPAGRVRQVTLTVTPPDELPPDRHPVVDVEAWAGDTLIGGFRKVFRPPVPIHRPRDPQYAESEIFVDPYPAIAGMPTQLGVEVFNPTDEDRMVTATFSVANFGIGLPFNTAHIAPNPILIHVPAHGAARGHVVWRPPDWSGKFCVRVTLQMEGHEPIWSQRNIDVGEPLRPGVPHDLTFRVGGWPHTEPVTIDLGLINHREGWDVRLSKDQLVGVQPGQPVRVKLTVIPPLDAELGTGEPIVDVEAFVQGELIGGFRKLDIPPVPLHKPHEKGYAESEIGIDPDPPELGQPTQVSTVVQNSSDETMTVALKFGWARFGVGIPFSTTGMVPVSRTLTLSPGMTDTAEVMWTPTYTGSHCIRVLLSDTAGVYEPQESQRNVRVLERPPCGETKVFSFTVYNDSPLAVTVDLGLITFDVPADWEVTTVPSDTLSLGPYSSGTVLVKVKIPCATSLDAVRARQEIYALQQAAGGVPTIDVEAYIDGDLVSGIELRFPEAASTIIYLPVVMRNR